MIAIKPIEEARAALMKGAMILTNQDYLRVSGLGKKMPKAYQFLYDTDEHRGRLLVASNETYVYASCPIKTPPTHKVLFDDAGNMALHPVNCPGCPLCQKNSHHEQQRREG